MCSLTYVDLISLSEHIPHMTHLKDLSISHLDKNVKFYEDGLLKILQQLSHSNVTTLNMFETGVCEFLKDSPHDYYSAMKALICPQSGRLEELHVSDEDSDDDTLAGLVSGPSSLKTLTLNVDDFSPYRMSNTCLTTLNVHSKGIFNHLTVNDILHMATIVEHNKTLQHLKFGKCNIKNVRVIDSLRTLVGAVSSSNTLKSIRIVLGNVTGSGDDMVSRYMRTHHSDLIADPRVTWERA